MDTDDLGGAERGSHCRDVVCRGVGLWLWLRPTVGNMAFFIGDIARIGVTLFVFKAVYPIHNMKA